MSSKSIDLDQLAYEYMASENSLNGTTSSGDQSKLASSTTVESQQSTQSAQSTAAPAPSTQRRNQENDPIEHIDPHDTRHGLAVTERRDSGVE